MRAGIFASNDPRALDVFAGMPPYYIRYARTFLFPKGGNGREPDAKILQKLKDLTNQEKLCAGQLQNVGEILAEATDHENAIWFYLASIRQARHEREKAESCTALSAIYRAMGDWQNSEKYLYMVAKPGKIHADALRQTADLAEKSGATDAAQRMREQIKNLGGQ
jgi:lipopolysaccharide biosynthesis regulator YciM